MFATKETISAFLSGVVRSFERPGVMYLVGEASLVLEGQRSFVTEIIVAADIAKEDIESFREAVDVAASKAGIAVTIEHPADVIPLPDRAAHGSNPVDGFENADTQLSIRHYDPYTTAIRFIARGDEPDYDLVVAFLEMGWIEMTRLDREIKELLPKFSFETIQQDPAEFRRKFKGLTQIWSAKTRAQSDGIRSGTVKV